MEKETDIISYAAFIPEHKQIYQIDPLAFQIRNTIYYSSIKLSATLVERNILRTFSPPF